MKNFHVYISENVLVYTKKEKHVDCATGETVVRVNSKISRKCELCHIKKNHCGSRPLYQKARTKSGAIVIGTMEFEIVCWLF